MYTSKPKSEKLSNKRKLVCYVQIDPYKKLTTDSSWPILSIQEFKGIPLEISNLLLIDPGDMDNVSNADNNNQTQNSTKDHNNIAMADPSTSDAVIFYYKIITQ